MPSGPSYFSEYLSKIYNIPHKSTFSNSSTETQDLDEIQANEQAPSLKSSIQPIGVETSLQRRYRGSPDHKDKDTKDVHLGMDSSVATETISLKELDRGVGDKESQSVRQVLREVGQVLHKEMKTGNSKSMGGCLAKNDPNTKDSIETEYILSSSSLDGISSSSTHTIQTFGRSQTDGPLAQSTLKTALDTAQIYIKPSEDEMDKTEQWTTAITEDSEKTEPWTTATQDLSSTGNMHKILESTQMWTGETMVKDDDTDDWLKQTSKKDVGAMQSILEKTELWDAPKEDPVETATDMNSVTPISNKSLLSKVADFKKKHLVLEEIRCKRCKEEVITKEALKMHTCYSIMDRVIQSDGGTRRRNSSTSGESKVGGAQSFKPPTQFVKRTKPKKKVNNIIALKDDRQPYVLTQNMIDQRIKANRVNEEKTKAVRPVLKRKIYEQVFINNPPVMDKIKDLRKGSSSMIPFKTSPESPIKHLKTKDQVKESPTNEIFAGSPKVAVIIENISKTRNSLTVNLPKQSLSQLKRKAESQYFIFKTSYYRKRFKGAEENVSKKTLPIVEETQEKASKHDKKIRKEEACKSNELDPVKRKLKKEVKEDGKRMENIEKKDCFEKGSEKALKHVKKIRKEEAGKSDELDLLMKLETNNKRKLKVKEEGRENIGKKGSVHVPKLVKPYMPDVEGQEEPLRKRHKSDKTPSSHKERESNERKVKSDEKNSSKDGLKSSQSDFGSSPVLFKIPKYKGNKPPKKVDGFATGKFLQNENIKTLKVGESGSSLLKDFLSNAKVHAATKALDDASSHGHCQADFMEMFDGMDSKQNIMANNKKFEAKEAQEQSDIMDDGWNQIKNTKTDVDRMKLAQAQFGNPISNNPNNNLTFHGFKARTKNANNSSNSDPSFDFWDKKMPMFYLSNGETKPLAGYTFKQRPNTVPECNIAHKMNIKVKISKFVDLMKTVLYNKKCKKMKQGHEKKTMEEFETYLAHYKGGLEETINFLKFYQNHGEVELEDWQTLEIMDLENQFSTYSGYYGVTDDMKCHTCNRKHKFAL